jgi:two-component system sensor histidine kinase/response regulator
MDDYRAKPVRAQEAGDSPETEDIDWAVALQRVGGDRELLRELLEVYLDECPRWLAQLHAALAGHDEAGVRRLAHTIKGSMGQFGAQAAFLAAQRLEMLGQDGTLAGAPEACVALEKELERIQPVLAWFARGSH